MAFDDIYITYLFSYMILSIAVGFLIIISYKILSRNPHNSLNQTFVAIAIIFVIYLALSVLNDILALTSTSVDHSFFYVLSFYFLVLGSGFLLLYLSILYKPNIMNNKTYQFLLILTHACVSSIIFFIPNGAVMTRSSSGQLSYAKYSLTFTIYLLVVFIVSLIIAIIMIMKIWKEFSDPEVFNKFRAIIVCIIVYYYCLIGIMIHGYIYNPYLRTIFEITQLIIIVSMILLYYALGRGLKK